MTVQLEVLGLIMRWVHIASVALLVGGVVYGRYVVYPSLKALSPMERPGIADQLASRYRKVLIGAPVALLVSGLYNLLRAGNHSGWYHMWFGIKMILAAHVFAVAFLIARRPSGRPQDDARRARQMTGIAVSGFVIILLSAYLRRIF